MKFRLGIRLRIPCSLVALVVFLAAPPPSACPQIPRADSLQRAKQLAWLNNWAESARVLDRLMRSGRLGDDEATRLFSGAVRIRGNIEALSLPAAAKDLAVMLSSDAAQRDPELRLEILAMKGDVEFQYDIPAAQKT